MLSLFGMLGAICGCLSDLVMRALAQRKINHVCKTACYALSLGQVFNPVNAVHLFRYHAIPEHFCTIECKPAIQKGEKSHSIDHASKSSGVSLTLADFHQAEVPNAGKLLPTATTTASSSIAGLLPTPAVSLANRDLQGHGVAPSPGPVIEVTPPPTQLWSAGIAASAVDPENHGSSNNNNSNNLVACVDSRPPSGLSMDSGYGGSALGSVRSVSPASDLDAGNNDADADRLKSGVVDAIGGDHGYGGSKQRPLRAVGFAPNLPESDFRWKPFSASPAAQETAAAPAIVSGECQPRTTSFTAEDGRLVNAFSHMNMSSGVGSQWPVGPEHRPDNFNNNINNGPEIGVGPGFPPSSFPLGLNPYGTNLAIAYSDHMECLLADKFSFSLSARHGRRWEAGSVSGSGGVWSDKMRRDSAAAASANSAIKYEWNHWSNSCNVDVEGGADAMAALTGGKELPFVPFSRLTFLRDEPMDVRGANGSNGFDVYVR